MLAQGQRGQQCGYTYWVSGITDDGSDTFVPVWVWLVQPQPPRSDFVTDFKVFKDLSVQGWVRSKELLQGGAFVPALCLNISSFSREETVVAQQFSSVARRQDDTPMGVIVATPIFNCGILRVVDQTELNGLCGVHVGV
jgi:hypothetical protein